jgi:serine/threonine-protein kinase
MPGVVPHHIGPYEVTREIGRGGMGVVYLAHDTKLDRDVAIKTLQEKTANDPGRLARFEREIKLIASLNHPNILTVHDVGREQDTLFVVTELLQGEDLRKRLTGGPLPWRDAVRIGIDLVDGLAIAHDRAIVHRDLKPANVFQTCEGLVKILDFGLARRDAESSTSTAEAQTGSYVTQFGQVVGTPGYMSPEQLRAETVDQRTDLFAVGCIMYEMLTGAPVFGRPTMAETTAAVLTESPKSLVAAGVPIPSELDRIVMRCLAKDADERFQSAAELRAALCGVAASGPSTTAAPPETREHSIAILPFVNQSSDPENEYFSDGIAEEIINMLAGIDGLRVAARTSAFSFKGRQVDIADVGRKLNVSTVLEGSVRKAGDRIRLTVQLVDAATGYPLWSERFDRDLDDIFVVQDEIAAAILDKLTLTFGVESGERKIASPTDNVAAYDHYLKARQHMGRGYGMALLKALDDLDAAVRLDPDFAAAHAGIAEVYSTLGFMAALPPRESMPKAKAAAERALELNDQLAEAHCALGCIHMQYDWDWAAAERQFKLAIELNPNFIQTYYHYGHPFLCYAAANRIDEGIALLRRAMELDPLATYPLHGLVANLLSTGELDESISLANHALELDPKSFHFRRLCGIGHFVAGRLDEAIENMETAVRDSGRHPWAMYEIGSFYAMTGRHAEAEAIHDELKARTLFSYVQPTALAMIAAWRGDLDEAFAMLDRALDGKDGIVYAITTWPMSRPIWDDPRYLDVLNRLGVSPPAVRAI